MWAHAFDEMDDEPARWRAESTTMAQVPENLPLPAGRLPDSPSPARGRALSVDSV